MMTTPTKFKPVILKNVCTKTYLDVFMHMIPSVELWENKKEHDVNYKKTQILFFKGNYSDMNSSLDSLIKSFELNNGAIINERFSISTVI